MVYATNREARAVAWVATRFTDEHRKALDWLNDNTPEDIAFFGLEIEVWRIGDSPPAAKFNVVCKPNELSKFEASGGSQSPTKLLQLEFWNAVKELAEAKGSPVRWRKPLPQHWYGTAVGRSGFAIDLTANSNTDELGCQLYIDGGATFDANDALESLANERQEIESDLGELDWQPLSNRRACRIIQTRPGSLTDKTAWDEMAAWVVDRAEAFHRVFGDRVRSLELDAPPDNNADD
ncbi:MAG: DUF4268 domain-containing protein [Actinomycetes bacterium]